MLRLLELLSAFLFLSLFLFLKRKRSIKKVQSLHSHQKVSLLNKILEPFGYSYASAGDIITAKTNAWQRPFGYRTLYDRSALHYAIVFECEPIYFDYNDRTYLIELCKGQYGISTGAEIGVYYTDHIIPPEKYRVTMFSSIPDAELLPLAFTLTCHDTILYTTGSRHWWLNGFRPGIHTASDALTLCASITFPDSNMLHSFTKGLLKLRYRQEEIFICGLTVTFCLSAPHSTQPRRKNSLPVLCTILKNRIFCALYKRLTAPFSCTLDTLLCLYFLLPFIFFRILHLQKHRKQKFYIPASSRYH